jgi:hypothetical protein
MRSCRAASAPRSPLAPPSALWQGSPRFQGARRFDVRRRGRWYGLKACCRSSVVEHSLGKGEVDSSILSGSTRNLQQKHDIKGRPLPFPPVFDREQAVNSPSELGENRGTLFIRCSARDRASTHWRPPPEIENRSPSAVATAAGAEVESILERTNKIYRKPDSHVQYAADPRRRNSRDRR